MKRFLLFLLCVIVIIGTVHMTSFAASLGVKVSYDAVAGKVNVSGDSESPVVVVVINRGDMPISDLSDTNHPAVFEPLIVTDGKFSTEIIMPDTCASGKYSVYITGDSAINIDEKFVHLNKASAQTPFNNLLFIGDDDVKFELAVRSDAESLGIDVNDEFYINNVDDIMDLLLVIRKDYTYSYELYNDYYKAYALTKMRGASATEIEYIFNKYEDQLIEKLDTYTMRLDTESKACFMTIISTTDYCKALKDTEFNSFLSKSVLVSEIVTAENGGDLNYIIETKYKTDFASMLSADPYYNKIPKTSRYIIYNEMMSNTITEYDDISSAFSKATAKVYSDIYSGSGSTTVPSGSSGNFGGGISIPYQNPPEPSAEASVSDLGVPILPTNSTSSFIDVNSDDWFYESVSALSQLNIVNGYHDNSFKPYANISRAEFTKLVYTTFKSALPEISNDTEYTAFLDVSRDEWFYSVIKDAAMSGIIQGSEGKFRPNDFIKREDAALIIYNAFKKMNIELAGVPTYDDKNEVSIYAYTAVGALSKYSILKGSDNKFRPLDNISRAEAVQLIYNSISHLQLQADKEG